MQSIISTAAALALSALAFGAAGITPAAANDGKSIVGASCFSRGNAGVTANGNLTSSDLLFRTTVRCALLRDNPNVRPLSVEVHVIDNSSVLIGLPNDGNFTCKVKLVNRFGKTVASGAERSTSGVNSAGTTLNLPIPSTNSVKGNYIVECQMPRRGALDPDSVLASIYYKETAQ